jgi:hypothetical protein
MVANGSGRPGRILKCGGKLVLDTPKVIAEATSSLSAAIIRNDGVGGSNPSCGTNDLEETGDETRH